MIDGCVSVLRKGGVRPVLVEIGAIDTPPPLWSTIASEAIYVGVGPVAVSSRNGPVFRDTHILNEVAVPRLTPDGTASLHVSTDPIFSSLLKARPEIERRFIDFDCCGEGVTSHSATTIDEALLRYSLASIDWLDTNVNGLDVELYQSISEPIRRRILAIDTVLFLMDIWQEQGSSVAQYPQFLADGFWLSRLRPWGPVRMSRESLQRALSSTVSKSLLTKYHRRAPGWIFVRFLRTVEDLRRGDFSRREYILLWAFATLDQQFGFAADVLLDYERAFSADRVSEQMWSQTRRLLRGLKPRPSLRSVASRLVPEFAKGLLRAVVYGD